ncbi:glutamate-1-semialdehyde 2,1-aminomutase [archaeon]|nr:glutamate-1-semialdehyde 2,1-aminomutase [archaeon]
MRKEHNLKRGEKGQFPPSIKKEGFNVQMPVKSEGLFNEARNYLVGGVNSPVRAMKPYPFFTVRGEGSRLYDVDNKSYIDYCLAYGPLILGHAYPKVVEAVREQMKKGSAYGTPTELEIKLAMKIVKAVPSAEMVRFVNTGTEATMGAIRLARGYTGRKKIIKFEGAFHGAHDYVLVKAGSGAIIHGVATSAGIPEETIKNTLLAPFNSRDAIERLVSENKDEIAAIILEPVIGNAGCILPEDDYLKFLGEITSENGIMLIFDEVITGFRLSYGGAQEYFGVKPDITTLGKIAGGGLPLGIITASKEIMEDFSPIGRVYQAGTFNGNPLSMASGIAALSELEDGRVYEKINSLTDKLTSGLKDITSDLGINTKIYSIASMYQMYITDEEVYDYTTALKAGAEDFLEYEKAMLKRGVFIPPSQFECNFISYAHSQRDIEETLEKAEEALKVIK